MAQPPTTMRSTIKDVAAAAGCSIKTVSRVLNNEKYVGAATRERVEAAVADLRFHPSYAARALGGKRSYQVALVCDNPSPYYLYEVQTGVRLRCRDSGVRMVTQPYDRDSPTLVDEIGGIVDQVRPDGLILTPPVSDDPAILAELQRRGLPFVRISPGTRLDLASSSYIDNEQAAADMTAHLIGLGHRRIGFVSGHSAYAASAQRQAGYTRALAGAGIAFDPGLVHPGQYDFASGSAAAEALLALDPPPTAIFASSDDMAAGALAVAHRRGIAVPGKLSIAGFDDTALASVVWPPLTTIRQPARALAHAAADLLLDPGPDIERRKIGHELIVRESTAPPG